VPQRRRLGATHALAAALHPAGPRATEVRRGSGEPVPRLCILCCFVAGHATPAPADNAPETMMSLVAGTPVPSGLKPSVSEHQRDSNFPYVVPA
jgi:hypothetical protein